MEMYAYDIECFPNFFIAIFVDVGDYFRIRESLSFETKADIFEQEVKKAKKHVFIINKDINDLARLISFVNRKVVLMSFNGLDYDDILLNACIANINRWKSVGYANQQLYQLSKTIIDNNRNNIYNDNSVLVYKRMRTFYTSVDVQKVFGLNKVLKSLKQTLINLKWYNIEDYKMPELTDYEITHVYSKEDVYLIQKGYMADWDRQVMPEHIAGIGNYCWNDVLGVCELAFQNKKEIALRFDISQKYSINAYSSSRSNIADRLFGKFYCEAANIEYGEYIKGRTFRSHIDIGDCIPSNVEFKTQELNTLLTTLMTTRIYNTKGEINFNVTVGDTTYKLATGGLHSDDKPAVFKVDSDTEMIDSDVTSYYPMTVQNCRIAPEHLDLDVFLGTTKGIIKDRIQAKHDSDVVTADTLKIVINVGVFGKMGFEDSPAFDPKAMVSVTIGGQLYLLMIIEDLYLNGFKVISANTDGIVTLVPKAKKDLYLKICKDWERKLNFEFEYTNYTKYIRMNVNHYLAVKALEPGATGDVPVKKRVKYKGMFNPNLYKEELTKGYKNPIVAQAISAYYLDDIPIMETLKSCRDILDFCATQKPGSQFTMEVHRVNNGVKEVVKLTKDVRFYVSRGQKELLSGLLLKHNAHSTGNREYTNVVAGRNVTIFNKRVDFDNFDDYKIDYGYYYSEAFKIITAVGAGSNVKKVIKKRYGQYNLFDM